MRKGISVVLLMIWLLMATPVVFGAELEVKATTILDNVSYTNVVTENCGINVLAKDEISSARILILDAEEVEKEAKTKKTENSYVLVWFFLFLISMVCNCVLLALVLLLIKRIKGSKKVAEKQIDDVPLVKYNIDDDLI